MTRASSKVWGWMAAAVLAWPTLAAAQAPARDGWQADIDAVVARYQLPGIAVGVVKDGEVVHVRTAGELVAGSGRAISDRALFKIASNSKAMTAALLARLVQQGKLRWDDPVIKHLPQFAMFDPWVTQQMQVRDLLIHNSGLPQGGGDLMFWPEPNAFTRADILQGLRHLKPAYSFRAGYAYDNSLYIVAGEVAAAAGGASYEQLIQREIFQPLGLAGCRVGEFAQGDAGDVAQPHRREDGRNVVVNADPPVIAAISSAAAGGIRCDLRSMVTWMRNWLAPTPAQLQWLDATQRAEMMKGRTPMPISSRKKAWENTRYYAYGYGFRVADFDGAWTVSHTGTLNGMYSMMWLLPDRKSGFVFMINGEGDAARTVLAQVLAQRLIHGRTLRSVASYADELAHPSGAASKSKMPDLAPARAVRADAVPRLLGVWRDPWLGEVRICRQGEGVQFDAVKSPRLTGPVQQLGGRTFVRWSDPGVDPPAWLDVAGEGAARTLAMAKLDPDGDSSSDFEDLAFTRVGDCDAPSPPPAVVTSPARTVRQAGLVDIATHVPDIARDMRYASTRNFIGSRIDGYQAPRCLLLAPVAQALAQVERDLRAQGHRLQLFDCYRPVRAVQHFMRWVEDAADVRNKAEYYPQLDKPALRGEYIAPVSGHSRGATVDVGLLRCDGPAPGDCHPLDMGTGFDFFGARANTDDAGITPAQRGHRALLLQAMARHGFVNYPMEWWHFTFKPEPAPAVQYDVPIR